MKQGSGFKCSGVYAFLILCAFAALREISYETSSGYWFLNRKVAKAAKPFSNRNGRFEKTAIIVSV